MKQVVHYYKTVDDEIVNRIDENTFEIMSPPLPTDYDGLPWYLCELLPRQINGKWYEQIGYKPWALRLIKIGYWLAFGHKWKRRILKQIVND